MEPHPLFAAFIGASYQHRRKRLNNAQKVRVPGQFARVES